MRLSGRFFWTKYFLWSSFWVFDYFSPFPHTFLSLSLNLNLSEIVVRFNFWIINEKSEKTFYEESVSIVLWKFLIFLFQSRHVCFFVEKEKKRISTTCDWLTSQSLLFSSSSSIRITIFIRKTLKEIQNHFWSNNYFL